MSNRIYSLFLTFFGLIGSDQKGSDPTRSGSATLGAGPFFPVLFSFGFSLVDKPNSLNHPKITPQCLFRTREMAGLKLRGCPTKRSQTYRHLPAYPLVS